MIRIRYPSNFSRKRWKLTAEPVFGAVVKLTREVSRLGITLAKVKLKGIDGGLHKRWSMWLNSMQREEPYLGLTWTGPGAKSPFSSESVHRCCMAVVSSCREMFG